MPIRNKRAYAAAVARNNKKKKSYSRRRRYTRGNGRYSIPKDLISAPKTGQWLGSSGGALLGNYIAPGIGGAIGGKLGGMLGEGAGSLFKSITGWGDYQVKSNSLLFPSQAVPSFGEDSIRVRKREFICNIDSRATGAGSFSMYSFAINPGLDESFPWLSSIAKNYEQYRINGMIYQFVSTSSDAISSVSNLGMGQIICATDYSAIDDDFEDPMQMLGSMFSTSAKPSENIMHAIECAPTDTPQKLYYVRTGSAVTNSDKRLWDLGKFQLATSNMPAIYPGMGQLWVSYDVTFCKSIMNNQLGFAINTDLYPTIPGITNAAIFGDGTAVVKDGSNLGCTLTPTVLSFPRNLGSGYYMVKYQCSGTAAVTADPNITLENCEKVYCWGTALSSIQTTAGTSNTRYAVTWIIKLKSPQATVTFGAATFPSSVTNGQLQVTQVNGDIYNDYATST